MGINSYAADIDLKAGSEVTIGSTTVSCEASTYQTPINGETCDVGNTVCVGLSPGSLCSNGSSKVERCIVNGYDPNTSFRSCSCQ